MTGTEKQIATADEFIDPICGMTVDPIAAAGTFNHEDKTYYFCSKGCLQKFIAQTQGVPASGHVEIGREQKETVPHGDMKATAGGDLLTRCAA